MLRMARRLIGMVRGFVQYVHYRLRRRASIKRAKDKDPNIYPLW